jgi:hypothetical protein
MKEYVTDPLKLIDAWLDSRVSSLLKMLRKPDLSWVDNFINDLLHNDDITDLEYLKKKYKVDVRFEAPSSKMKNNAFIIRASYSTKMHLYTFIVRKDFGSLGNIDNALAQEIREFYTYEQTHEQQDQLKSSLQRYYDGSEDDIAQYLSQDEEITAMARGVAYTIKSRSSLEEDDDVVKAIVMNDTAILNFLPDKDQATVALYREIGGNAWKKFLKSVYSYFNSSTASYLGQIEYRKWLKDHSSEEN